MKITLLLLATLVLCSSSFCQPNFIKRLQKAPAQPLVVNVTCLSRGGAESAWIPLVSAAILEQFGDGLIQYCLAGKGGMSSVWGVKNLEDSVIAQKPDA